MSAGFLWVRGQHITVSFRELVQAYSTQSASQQSFVFAGFRWVCGQHIQRPGQPVAAAARKRQVGGIPGQYDWLAPLRTGAAPLTTAIPPLLKNGQAESD